jgi:hypothetical protein
MPLKKGDHVEFEADEKWVKLHGIVRHVNNNDTATIQFLDPSKRQSVFKDVPIAFLKQVETKSNE